jgi:hypothetical protein
MQPAKQNPLTPARQTASRNPLTYVVHILTPNPTKTEDAIVPRLGKTRCHSTVPLREAYQVLINLQLQIILTPKLIQLAQTSPSPPMFRPFNNPHDAARKTIENTIIARDCLAKSRVVATDAINDSVTPLMAMMGI